MFIHWYEAATKGSFTLLRFPRASVADTSEMGYYIEGLSE